MYGVRLKLYSTITLSLTIGHALWSVKLHTKKTQIGHGLEDVLFLCHQEIHHQESVQTLIGLRLIQD